MNRDEVIFAAETGDVLLCRGPWWVRSATAEGIGHVAMAVLVRGIPTVYEYTITGFHETLLTQWLKKRKGPVWLGKAPAQVRENGARVVAAVLKHRPARYDFFGAVKIVLSTIFGRNMGRVVRMCSPFVQEIWESAGWKGPGRPMDPGDFMRYCDKIVFIS